MTATATETLNPNGQQQLLELPLELIIPSTENTRRDLGDVAGLAMSIKTSGLWQPIVVSTQNDDGTYTIIAGHRRRAACELAALDTVTVIVRDDEDGAQAVGRVIENIQREDLSPLEEAAGYRQLLDEHEFSQRELAERVGRSQGHISKRLALLGLPEEIQTQIDAGGIQLADALELTKLSGDVALIDRALAGANDWTTVSDSVEKVLDEKKRQDAIDSRVDALRAAGKTAVAQIVQGYQDKLPKGAVKIAKTAQFGAVLLIDPRTHAKLDCHAIAVGAGPGSDVAVCTNRRNHPGVKTADQKRQKRQESGSSTSNSSYEKQRARQGELKEVEAARMKFLAELLGRKTAFTKTEALDLILRHVIKSVRIYGDADEVFTKLVGIDSDDVDDKKLDEWAAKNGELTRIALIATLLDTANDTCGTWQGAQGRWDADDVAWLTFLEQRGYELTDAERAAMPKAKTKKASS